MDKKIRLVASPFGQVVLPVAGRVSVRETRWRVRIEGWRRCWSVEKLVAGALAGLMIFYGVCSFLIQLAEYGW